MSGDGRIPAPASETHWCSTSSIRTYPNRPTPRCRYSSCKPTTTPAPSGEPDPRRALLRATVQCRTSSRWRVRRRMRRDTIIRSERHKRRVHPQRVRLPVVHQLRGDPDRALADISTKRHHLPGAGVRPAAGLASQGQTAPVTVRSIRECPSRDWPPGIRARAGFRWQPGRAQTPAPPARPPGRARRHRHRPRVRARR
jgi:hypothetical protein